MDLTARTRFHLLSVDLGTFKSWKARRFLMSTITLVLSYLCWDALAVLQGNTREHEQVRDELTVDKLEQWASLKEPSPTRREEAEIMKVLSMTTSKHSSTTMNKSD